MLILIPLFLALVLPRVIYTPINPADNADESAVNESSFLVPAGGVPPSSGLSPVPIFEGEASKYGTFQAAHPAIPPSGPVSRTPTPVPSHTADKVSSAVNTTQYIANVSKQSDRKPEVALDPSWGEIFRRIKRIAPYLWPSKSIALQFLVVSTTRVPIRIL